jgi:hypothetical protein
MAFAERFIIPLIYVSCMAHMHLSSLGASKHFVRLLNFLKMLEIPPFLPMMGEAVRAEFEFRSLACSLNLPTVLTSLAH